MNNKCREHNMKRKFSDSHYANNQERTNLNKGNKRSSNWKGSIATC